MQNTSKKQKNVRPTRAKIAPAPDRPAATHHEEADEILKLQRLIGNRAVGRLFAENELGQSGPDREPALTGRSEKAASQKGIEDEEEPAKKEGATKGVAATKGAAADCDCGEDEKHKMEKAAVGGRYEAVFRRQRTGPAGSWRFDSSQAGGHRSTHAHSRDEQIIQRAPPVLPLGPAPIGVAALNFLPVKFDKVPTGWGVTTEDDPVIDITAYKSGANWKCVVSKADQQAHQGIRLLPGVKEVTPALVAGESNCAKLTTMSNSLNTVANQGAHSGYYMKAAVQAHENLHIAEYRRDLAPHFTAFKTTVEALTVPVASYATSAAAKAAIKALPAFTAAKTTFSAADVAANNATAAHTSGATFNVVEHGVVDPMIAIIATRKVALKCTP